jgi:general secretion pathway protein G
MQAQNRVRDGVSLAKRKWGRGNRRSASRRAGQRGLSLVELIVAFTILLILSTMAVPLTRARIRTTRERELRYALGEIHDAIDKYKDFCDASYFGPAKQGTNCYPETLDILVEGQKLAGPDGKKVRFLRRIPVDPFTGKAEWGMRSDSDDPKATAWGGQDVFQVYTKTTEKAPDGTPYSDW